MFPCLSALQVRALSGVPATIYLLLMSEPAGGNQEWIERYSGFSDKPVKQALALLVELGMVSRCGVRGSYTYHLVRPDQERQLPLPVERIEAGPEIVDAVAADAQAPNAPGPEFPAQETADEDQPAGRLGKIESEKLRLAPLASSSSRSLNLDSRENLLPPDSRRAVESENFRLAALLDRAEVRDPAKSRLLRGGFDPEVIEAHLRLSDSTGQAIYRIEHNWPVAWDKWRDWQQFHCRECGGTIYPGEQCYRCAPNEEGEEDDDDGSGEVE
jgi:hypothetical protein